MCFLRRREPQVYLFQLAVRGAVIQAARVLSQENIEIDKQRFATIVATMKEALKNDTVVLNQTLEFLNRRAPNPDPHWDYHGSLFFMMTIMTTVGYGSFTPNTVGGQVWTL